MKNPNYNYSFYSCYGRKYEGVCSIYYHEHFSYFSKQLRKEIIEGNNKGYNNIIFLDDHIDNDGKPILFCEIIDKKEYDVIPNESRDEYGTYDLYTTSFKIKLTRFIKSNVIYSESEWVMTFNEYDSPKKLSVNSRHHSFSFKSISIFGLDPEMTREEVSKKLSLKDIELNELCYKNLLLKFDLTKNYGSSEEWMFDGKLRLYNGFLGGGDGVIEVENLFYGHTKKCEYMYDYNKEKKIKWKWISGNLGCSDNKKYSRGELHWEMMNKNDSHKKNNIHPCEKIYHFKYYDNNDKIIFEVSGCGSHLTDKCYWKFKSVKDIYINNFESSVISKIINHFKKSSDIVGHFLWDISYTLRHHSNFIGSIDQNKYLSSDGPNIETTSQFYVYDPTKPKSVGNDSYEGMSEFLNQEDYYCSICESQSHNDENCPSLG